MDILPDLLLTSILVSVINICQVQSLQCYTCDGEDTNDNCLGANSVRTCSITQDRCLTQVTYSRERGKLHIDKRCASTQGCTAASDQLAKYYFCDKSRNGWGCVDCCATDRCNTSGGVSIQCKLWLPIFTASLSVLLAIIVNEFMW